MNKTKLQELCHKMHWVPPEYTHCRMGPDHQPRYSAFVSVNGSVFDSPDAESSSSKEAHNKAAGVALESLSTIADPSPPATPMTMAVVQSADSKAPQTEDQVNIKSQLQIYAQKRYKELPKYTTIREDAPKRAPLFKSVVTIDGQSFESPKFFNSLKLAEQAAAELALSLLSKKEEKETSQEISLDEATNYKSLLQEIMQKERKLLPVYVTVNDPDTLIPTFSSTIEIDGLSFKGESAKSKKQAETNSAKLALQHLKDRKQTQVSTGVLMKSLKPCSSNEKLNGVNPKMNDRSVSPNSPIRVLNSDQALSGNYKYVPVESTKPLINPPKPESIKSTQSHNTNSDSKESTKTGSTVDQSVVSSGCGSGSVEEKENGKGGGAEPSFLSHRVQIFPKKPDLVLPPGATLLPCSDDTWVAVELDYQNQEGSNGACMYASMGIN
ncbi:hypothetical protein LUZ60_001509 [Juncus effusus]|nr:hypothetical protein LUZ60_001509 [Juncus effusus]